MGSAREAVGSCLGQLDRSPEGLHRVLEPSETQLGNYLTVGMPNMIRLQMSVFLIRARSVLEVGRGYRLEPEDGESLVSYTCLTRVDLSPSSGHSSNSSGSSA